MLSTILSVCLFVCWLFDQKIKEISVEIIIQTLLKLYNIINIYYNFKYTYAKKKKNTLNILFYLFFIHLITQILLQVTFVAVAIAAAIVAAINWAQTTKQATDRLNCILRFKIYLKTTVCLLIFRCLTKLYI